MAMTETRKRKAATDYADDEARWQAVLAKDAAADGRFVLAVTSTGIYCRPICKARLPLRRNVLFYDSAEEAARAGFRPCKKCLGETSGDARRMRAVETAVRLLDEAEECAPSLEALAEASGLSPHYLQRSFKAAMGVSPRQYWDARRLDRLKANLKSGEPVAPALYGAGYGSSSRLYEKAKEQLGMTPATYGKGGKGAVIGYTIAACPLGHVIVGATEAGICFLGLGDDPASLEAELRGDFPEAEIVREDTTLGRMVGQVVAHLEGREPHIALPLDVRATAFQRQVWEALMAIPYGETRTYAELAAQLGRPQAPRAVGRACASNPVSLVVPCHRAVGSSGSLTGYRWGLKRKEKLIAGERANRGRAMADAD